MGDKTMNCQFCMEEVEPETGKIDKTIIGAIYLIPLAIFCVAYYKIGFTYAIIIMLVLDSIGMLYIQKKRKTKYCPKCQHPLETQNG
ncbi:MAG: hypothetical protein HPY50_12285 [Firmicutes bacterium]|nr:hypothetical protein [Bacillota bacterium]